MSRIAYVNGRYVRHAEAAVHIEDRGYQFADGVYEVCEIWRGKVVDERRHLDRLERSLRELSIAMPMSRAALAQVMREVIRRNRVQSGIVYLQVTRGVARRDHVFPPAGTKPALVITSRAVRPEVGDKAAEAGVGVITVPENRWERVDIKSVGLLPNVLVKQKAKEAGAKEAWFVDADGFVTEGGSTNAWIITTDNTLVTRPAEHGILAGITRRVVLDMIEREGLSFDERPFTVEEAKNAKEAFITAATTLVMPVVKVDDTVIGNGHPGSFASELRSKFHEVSELEPV
ncbi:D-amino-acid transaminase [Stappia taiwanensis]|uniref:Probable branched-chain-amino-acid aminotransferase n=1 Tax=Stappia taiwanensis TaxID=992267 RepID=A0A838XPK2_9HYPH|nr:D-amino-acid transaminase [Stappia taiwanensis]MBA4613179.1 D-amino-acid transaminase [Stappia taiwanensis]GGE79837.1 D-amino-acid transaminase [Stappia taiwanensis]